MRRSGEILRPLIAFDENGCWRWLGKVNKTTGYGHKQLGGKTVLAHRWVYSMFRGWIPDGLYIDHLCRNRWCVNPKHLEPVSQAENCRRGRASKLSVEQVREIKRFLPTARWGQRAVLASKYGVSPALISDIKYGRAWADVSPDE